MESNEASMCPLCRHEKVKIFAVGECSHPVCHLCSTKMRILCEQTYCAICRQELPQVYFVSDVSETQPTIDQSRFTPIDETGDCGIYYPKKSEWIRRDTEKLLRNFCPFCHTEFETFEILRDHVRRAHRYFYCDLCVEHLNLFPFERKCYTRQDLVQHTRYGDKDDTSFKGHPLCRFCDDHFLDVDQLYQHMRKEHYYCHLCTSDNVYYSDFDLLRDHYRTTHYLCEIDQCKDVQFTNVFASETDFRAHQAAQHSKSRAHARQLGTIAVEFQSASIRDRKQQHEPARRGVFKSGEFNTQGNNNSTRNERDDIQPEPAVPVSVPSINEFPSLGEHSSASQNLSQRGAWSNDQSKGIHSHTDFPALTGAATNAPNATQTRGIWREQQQQQQTVMSPASTTQNATSKKAPQSSKPTTNGGSAITAKEDFPALKGAVHKKIPAPVSMLSAWTTAKKSAKNASATAKGNQPQMRMNTNRLLNDDDDEEYIRRPMASLTTSTTPAASSNITMITASNLSDGQSNDKANKTKNQSVPNAHDFPALSSTNTTQNSASSGVWTAAGANSLTKSPSAQQKKKNSAMSKKKFMEEMQSMPPAPPSLSSTSDFPIMDLNELGRRLITEENEPISTREVKKEKPSTPVQTSQSVKKENKEKNPSSVQSTKKSPKTNEPVKEETSLSKTENPTKPVNNQVSSQPPPLPPPGFSSVSSISPPPGFQSIPPPSESPTYHISSSYTKQKNNFHTKLFDLFDGDMNLFGEYDKFCEAYSQKKITTDDFLTYTKQLFKDKLDEYLLELLIIIPNIDQQNELYTIWKSDIHPSTTETNSNNWSKKTSNENNIYICRICRQIMFDDDTNEHNSTHSEFNTQFPSLPAAALPLGRGSGKKKK